MRKEGRKEGMKMTEKKIVHGGITPTDNE